jgi:hypothetical protein
MADLIIQKGDAVKIVASNEWAWRDLRCAKLDLIIRELQEMRRELREDLERMDAEDLARVVPKDYK